MRDPGTRTRDRTQRLDPETGTRDRNQRPEPETRTRDRNQRPDPETGTRDQNQRPEPETGTRDRTQRPDPETGPRDRTLPCPLISVSNSQSLSSKAQPAGVERQVERRCGVATPHGTEKVIQLTKVNLIILQRATRLC
ncbi:hypothetical protein EYF80_065508 [Liparis tanakae]|uniref:Uncharacterized protein n=1 Tax=Liparis tanakae TaxID=230148 RepID=A0A4Z2E6F1_9TELE|nr:hypothetical protein EYF80_065508 [Liparis tanakae]